MNLNGLVLNLSLSGPCVHAVVELQPAAERPPHQQPQIRQEEGLCVQRMLTRPSKSSPSTCRETVM